MSRTSRAIIRAGTTALSTGQKSDSAIVESRKSESTSGTVLEVSKARRIQFEAVADLTINFRKFADHTDFGTAADEALRLGLRTEAAEMAAAIKQTVPGETWDWLCKILSDEYMKTIAEADGNMRRVRRYYGGEDKVPDVVKKFYKK